MAHSESLAEILPEDVTMPQRMAPADRLFRHTDKPEWGVGLWVQEERSRRRLRFEDGRQRAFKKGFYEKLKIVDPDKVDVEDMFEELADEEERARAEHELREARQAHPPVMSFEDQIRVFRAIYPDGFEDEAYVRTWRTKEGSTTSKHLTDGAAFAAQMLASARMREKLDAGEGPALADEIVDVLQRTALVATRRVSPLRHLHDDKKIEFARAAFELLHGDERFRRRFRPWMNALLETLGDDARWTVATALPALVDPDEHVCVKRSVFRLQARAVAPRAVLKKTPGPRGYRHARKVARATRDRLMEAGLKPRDLLDVRTFIWETLRPKGQKTLDELNGNA